MDVSAPGLPATGGPLPKSRSAGPLRGDCRRRGHETKRLPLQFCFACFYPPLFGLVWVLFLPPGFTAAEVVLFFLHVELAPGGRYLLWPALPGVPPWVPVLLASLSFFSVPCVLLGQTAVLVLFLAA